MDLFSTQNNAGLVDFLSGAVALGYFLAAFFFFRFWRRTRDRLFLHFAAAFWLFTLNQIFVSAFGAPGERSGYVYILRVLGFIIILIAIVDKNTLPSRRR